MGTTLAPEICDCGVVPIPVGALAVYRDGIDHRPGPEDCTPSDVIVVTAPTLAEGIDLIAAEVAKRDAP